jgi:hypothetical protein
MWFWLGIWAIMPTWFFNNRRHYQNNSIDEQGLDVDYIKTRFVKAIRCVYICANRDYPTTVSLTAERRLKLLQLAKEYQFAIIELWLWQFHATYGQLRCKWNGDLFGKAWTIFISEQTGFVVARKFNFRSQELFANAGPPRRFNKNKCYPNWFMKVKFIDYSKKHTGL